MRILFISCVLAVFSPAAIQAEPVSEAEFLAAFDEKHASVRALQDGLARAEAERTRARTLANPRLDVSREAPERSPKVTNWTVGWTPPLDGRYRLGKQYAERGVAAARARLDLDRAEQRRTLRRDFEIWSFGHETRDILRLQLDVVKDLAEREARRAESGETSGLSAKRFALAEAELRSELARAKADGMIAEAVVRSWRPDLPLDATPAPIDLVTPPDSLMPGDSLELHALRLEKEQADLAWRRTRRFWGAPTVQVGWQTIEDRSGDDSGPIVAAGWALPVFDRDKAGRQEALARSGILGARLEVAKARIGGELEGRLAAYRVLFDSAREAHESLPRTDAVIEAVSEAYLAGETGLTDLLETFRTATQARLQEVLARERAAEAHRDLEALLGRSLTEGDAR